MLRNSRGLATLARGHAAQRSLRNLRASPFRTCPTYPPKRAHAAGGTPSPSAHSAMAFHLLRELSSADKSDMCEKEKHANCVASVEQHARALESLDRESSAASRIRARLLRLEGNPQAAQDLLAPRCGVVTDRSDCLYARLEAAAEAKSPSQVANVTREYLAARCGSAAECADAASAVGD